MYTEYVDQIGVPVSATTSLSTTTGFTVSDGRFRRQEKDGKKAKGTRWLA